MLCVCAIAIVVLCSLMGLGEATLKQDRTWMVDYDADSGNYIFRGNMPCNDTSYQYDTLMEYMAGRAADAGVPFPGYPDTLPYLVDISFNNGFDGEGFTLDKQFWKDGANADKGEFINWPLFGEFVMPQTVAVHKRKELIKNGTVWAIDHLSERTAKLRSMFQTKQKQVTAYFVHCTAGCDRTGEFVAAYNMQYSMKHMAHHNMTGVYELDAEQCGRAPNYWSSSAIGWFCYTLQYQNGTDLGDCAGFADCQLPPSSECQPVD
jgi:hypothetical protein